MRKTKNQIIHNRFYHFFTGYRYALTLVGIMLLSTVYTISAKTNTSGITISDESMVLTCAPEIRIYDGKNAADFIKNKQPKYKDISFKSIICSVNALYDGSERDNEALLDFTRHNLSFWPFQRKDIKAYFLQKARSISDSGNTKN